jgi:Right handed beta helix region
MLDLGRVIMNREMVGSGRIVWVAATAILFVVCSAWGKVIYVDDDAPASGDGTSWATAYRFLQDALLDAEGEEEPVEIRVAQGVYWPDQSSANPQGTRDAGASFRLGSDMLLQGGYAGLGGSDPNSRAGGRFGTVLSGDLDGNDLFGIDCADLLGDARRSENSNSIILADYVEAATLDGCMITGGNSLGGGGGVYCYHSSLSVMNCRFVGNTSSEEGGAVSVHLGGVEMGNCDFVDNAADFEGGAIYAVSASAVVLRSCAFSDNCASAGDCLYGRDSSVMLRNCLIDDCASAVGIDRGTLSMVNCTLAGNTSTEGPTVDLGDGSVAEVRNCILWNVGEEIAGKSTSHLEINYCDVQGGRAAVGIPDENVVWGQGNIDQDPRLVNPETGDFHLQAHRRYVPGQGWVQDAAASPCIDSGHPLDFVGYEPLPNGGRINMGAYGGTPEASPSYAEGAVCMAQPPGDINGDGSVDFRDMGIVASHWLEESPCLDTNRDRSAYFPFSVGMSWTYTDGQREMNFRVIGKEEVEGHTYYRLNDYFNLSSSFGDSPTVGQEVLCRYDPERQSLLIRLEGGQDAEVFHLVEESVWEIRRVGIYLEALWYLVDEAWPCDVGSGSFLSGRFEVMRDGADVWETVYLAPRVGILKYVCPDYTDSRQGYHKRHVFRLKDYGVVDTR